MSLIPQVSLSDFKKLKATEIKQLKSVEVISDGDYLFTAIIPPVGSGMTIEGVIKTEAEYLGCRSNTVGGKELEALKNAAV